MLAKEVGAALQSRILSFVSVPMTYPIVKFIDGTQFFTAIHSSKPICITIIRLSEYEPGEPLSKLNFRDYRNINIFMHSLLGHLKRWSTATAIKRDYVNEMG